MSLSLDLAVPTSPTPGTKPWTVRAGETLRHTQHIADHSFLKRCGVACPSPLRAEPVAEADVHFYFNPREQEGEKGGVKQGRREKQLKNVLGSSFCLLSRVTYCSKSSSVSQKSLGVIEEEKKFVH